MLLSKATYIAFKLQFYILSALNKIFITKVLSSYNAKLS